MAKPGGTLAPNQAALKALTVLALPSMNTADWPGASVATPVSGTALANAFELSSILKPVRSTVRGPVLVSSHQSALYGASPLLQGDTSVTASAGAAAPTVMLSVNGALTASGEPPTPGSSTATLTVYDGLAMWSSAVPAFRYRPLSSTVNAPASGPVTDRLSTPRPSGSVTSTS